jgi:hypothetical protein
MVAHTAIQLVLMCQPVYKRSKTYALHLTGYHDLTGYNIIRHFLKSPRAVKRWGKPKNT